VNKRDPHYVEMKDIALFEFLKQQFADKQWKDMIEKKGLDQSKVIDIQESKDIDKKGSKKAPKPKVMNKKTFRDLINKTVFISPGSFTSFFGLSIGNMLRHALKRR
jgi:hypothetical protein